MSGAERLGRGVPVGCRDHLGAALVDIANQRVVPLSNPGEPSASADGWFALGSTKYLYDPSGQPRYRLPDTAFAPSQLPFGGHLFAAGADRVLMINFLNELALHVIETVHCTVEHRVALRVSANKMQMAPGVLLVLRESDGEPHLDGF